MEPIVHILLFPFSLSPFHGDKMNSALNLINPQRFHVLIPKVKGVIVLTNEVSVPPSGNKGKREQSTQLRERPWILTQWLFFSSPAPLVNKGVIRWQEASQAGTRVVLLSVHEYKPRHHNEKIKNKKSLLICNDE